MRRASFILPAAANTWSIEDVRRLRELAATGLHLREISLILERSESAVRNKAGLHGIGLTSARHCVERD